ncbi:MAG TPA: PSD1 and planctomycete cytochrome C domain-containing protein [Lacipirellulaceae bacterium]
MRYDRRRLTGIATLLLVGAAGRAALTAEDDQSAEAGPRLSGPAATTEGIEFFETHIRPVLVERCYECHSGTAKVLQGGLRLDSADGLRKGGDSGTAIVPYKPDDSLLISALRYESLEMPPSGKLPDKVIDDFIKWISLGAPDPRTEAAAGKADAEEPTDPFGHWAYQRPQRPNPPKVSDRTWARSEIDRFILAKLEKVGVSPSPQAPPRALLRRVYYDLIGLPPTAKELAEFEADPSDARYEAAVDWLLSVPQYGERWARHWLDIARYADTKGYLFEEDRNYKHAYKYRDWVISSFATDRPYDEFLVAQLAADQTGDPACVPAMGFLTLGRRFLNNRHDIINDRIDVVTRGLMGLTVACARCHDHKYDPISAGDYYALYGVFASSEEKPRDDAPPMLVDAERLVDPVIFLRGSPGSRGPKVDRRFLTCLAPDNKPEPFQHGSGRLELAQTIASRENPLTARVWVNRVWGHLFGRGLVNTPSDFGSRGSPPTHPELLDWLACEVMEDGWSTKRLIRRIVLSSTYRQASNERSECVVVDPENLLLWRANRRRLDLESLRDSVLAAAGRLDATIGGPSVPLTASPFPTRRAVYGFIERQNLPAFFRTFDFANPNTHTPERPQTVAPQQALFLMNSPFVMEQAAHLAARTANTSEGAAAENDSAKAARIALVFQHALGREPTAEEMAEAIAFVSGGELPGSTSAPELSRWEQLAQVLLMSNEFAFVD